MSAQSPAAFATPPSRGFLRDTPGKFVCGDRFYNQWCVPRPRRGKARRMATPSGATTASAHVHAMCMRV